jgi:hypothetical protein
MVGVREFGRPRSKRGRRFAADQAYGNEGIALTLLGAEDRVGYFAASGAVDEPDSSTGHALIVLGGVPDTLV